MNKEAKPIDVALVRSESIQSRFWSKVTRVEEGCWEWTGTKDKDGYGVFKIRPKMYRAHRMVYVMANDVDPGSLVVCHRCDRPDCVNPKHLFLGTAGDNVRDMISKGRCTPASGENSGTAKLSNDEARQIRDLYSTGLSMKSIADRYDVCRGTVSKIVKGVSFKSADGNTFATDNRSHSAYRKKSGSKISEDDVREIRHMTASGDYTALYISGKFGISEATVQDIKKGRSWKHVI